MRWLTNTMRSRAEGEPDPLDMTPGAGGPPVSYGDAKRHIKEWMKGKVVGPPKETKECTVVQLEAMGLVGVYEPHRSIIVTTEEAPDRNHPEADQKE